MSFSVRRSRFRVRVEEEDTVVDPIVDPVTDVGSRSSTGSSTDQGEEEGDLESMTGKGIKRLCSELLELKRVSDEDFQRNVHSNYYTFIRIFEEVEDVESEITQLRECVSTQRNLVQSLTSNLYSDIIVDGVKDTKVEDLGLNPPTSLEIHMQDVLATLDTLLLEFRLNEALSILEKENLTLQQFKMEEDRSSPIVMSYTYALAERRTRVSDQLALMAEHPRVAQPELQRALSGLFKLGESYRANALLVKFYRSRLKKRVDLLRCSEPCLYGTYIRDLAKLVFSAIFQAARCFVILCGETFPYASELILWAREEIEIFGENFYAYIKSISEVNGGITLAVEAANCAISLCSLLKSQRIVLVPMLMELIRPSMEEVLQRHVDHLKKVVHIFSASDNWVLSKFLTLGILRDRSSLLGIGEKVEYCLLTSSGKKFVTLMQAIVDDIYPLVNLRMGNSILEGLADLFNEYVQTLERAVSSRQIAMENNPSKAGNARTIKQQLSVLVNVSTLVQFFPSIAGSIFKAVKSSDKDLSADQTEIFSQDELDNWILSMEKIADQLRGYFCEQFVLRVMSHGDFESETCLDDGCIPNSSQNLVPSSVFQALFMRLRKLQQLSESIFDGEDEKIKMLPKEIMETVMVWLSNNQEFWINTMESSCIRHCSCFDQVHIDMHFLMEIAMLGGYCSEDLIAAVMDLIEEMEVALTEDGAIPDESLVLDAAKLASDAAKSAIRKLLDAEAANLEPKIEKTATSIRDSKIQNLEGEHPSDVIDLIDGSQCTADDAATSLIDIKDNNEAGEFSGSEGTRELESSGVTVNSNVKSFPYFTEFDVLASQIAVEDPQVIAGNGNPLLENTILENPEGEPVSNLNELGAVAAKLTIEEPQDITVKGTPFVEPTADPKTKTAGKLQEYDTFTAQPATEKPQDIIQQQNLMSELRGIEVVQELEAKEGSFDNLDECGAIEDKSEISEQLIVTKKNLLAKRWVVNAAYDLHLFSEVDKSPSDALVEDLERKLVMTEGNDISLTISKELVQVDTSNVEDEPTTIEDQEHLLSENFSSAGSAKPRIVKRRYKRTSSEKNMKGPIRPDSKLSFEAKLVMLEQDVSRFIVSEELVQVEKSKVEGEPNNKDRDTLPYDKIVIPPESRGKNIVGLLRQQGVIEQFKFSSGNNRKGSNALGSLFSIQAHESKMVKLEDDTVPRTLSNELNGEPDMLETPRIEDKDIQLSDSLGKQEEDCVILVMDNENVLKNGSSSSDSEGDYQDLVHSSKIEGEPVRFDQLAVNDGDNLLSNNTSAIVLDSSPQNEGDVLLVESSQNTSDGSEEIVQVDTVKDVNGQNTTETRDQSAALNKVCNVILEEDITLIFDNSKVEGEAATSDPLKTAEEDKLLSLKISGLALETSPEKQGSDNSKTEGSTGESSGSPVQQKGGKKRSKSISEENSNLVKSGKGAKALRPRWQ